MAYSINLPLKGEHFFSKYSSRCLISNAKHHTNSSEFESEYKTMKMNYAEFMKTHPNDMSTFYSDWNVNAIKGLLQTGRFSKYGDEILNELLPCIKIVPCIKRSDDNFIMSHKQPIRENMVGVVAPPCAGKSTAAERNSQLQNCLVLDGSWLIGTASRQLLGSKQGQKFQFSDSFGKHSRFKHVQIIRDLFPEVMGQVNSWLDALSMR